MLGRVRISSVLMRTSLRRKKISASTEVDQFAHQERGTKGCTQQWCRQLCYGHIVFLGRNSRGR